MPIIALLTDFGLRDHYVGTMKGVALRICPTATLVDITHEIPPQDVIGAALALAAAFRYFLPGTIFLAVVDPGVGSSRKAIAVEAGEYQFVAPDNGVLSAVLEDVPAKRAIELTDPTYALARISRTFEGRDRFAPAAAWLARGTDISALGPAAGPLVRLQLPRPVVGADSIHGEILRVDRFGNAISNVDRAMLDMFARGGAVDVEVNGQVLPLVETYANVAPGQLCALVGSADVLEIALNGGDAADALRLGRGTLVRVRRQ